MKNGSIQKKLVLEREWLLEPNERENYIVTNLCAYTVVNLIIYFTSSKDVILNITKN